MKTIFFIFTILCTIIIEASSNTAQALQKPPSPTPASAKSLSSEDSLTLSSDSDAPKPKKNVRRLTMPVMLREIVEDVNTTVDFENDSEISVSLKVAAEVVDKAQGEELSDSDLQTVKILFDISTKLIAKHAAKLPMQKNCTFRPIISPRNNTQA